MANLLLLFVAVQATLLLKSSLPLAAYVFGSLGFTAWQSRHHDHLRWYRLIRPEIIVANVLVLCVVAAVAIGLLSLDNPVLNFGWYSLLSSSIGDDTGAANVITAPLRVPILIAPFALLLLFVLPRLAESEELLFRRGTKNWSHGMRRSLVFGLVHMIVGVPLGAALALSVGGLWFTHQYFKGGVQRSTLYHLTYNLIVFALVIVAAIAGAI
jgi:hypothetical protein